jgi:predicted enzyme related to lactoylglutathione lyase
MAETLGLVILAVEQLSRSADFYTMAFGWPRAVDTAVYVELTLPQGMRLGLYDRESFAKNVGQSAAPHPNTITATELYLYVDNVEATIARALTAGARILSPLLWRAWGDNVAYVADPDGNVVALAKPL